MRQIRYFVLLIVLIFVSHLSWAQSKNTDKINLQKIIFHSSICEGTCPKIDFQVDSKKNIVVNREYVDTIYRKDESKSGHFKGVLNDTTFNQLLLVLKKSNFKRLKFPDIDCCDGIITTIIIYSDNKRTYLKSMTPPTEALELISFLYKIGAATRLTKTNDETTFEE